MKRTVRKDRILNAVMDELHKGNNSFTMRDIAETAQVSIGLLYYHYADRDALLKEVHDLYMQKISELLHSIRSTTTPLCYEITHQLVHLILHRNNPPLGTIFLRCVEQYSSYTRESLQAIFDSFSIPLLPERLELETQFYIAMIKQGTTIVMSDTDISPEHILHLIIAKLLCPYGIAEERLDPCFVHASQILEEAEGEGRSFLTIDPAS
ncbi:MAG: TetR/AcrR family transcriptional regulator [Spirochaetia bacterium]|nr:TetR/AcrR family transcriptional regulator [Spirochaetia bacterium]